MQQPRLLCVILTLLLAAPAFGDTETAKAQYKKGLSAYALGDYAEAAKAYEAAFNAEPDPALLYNAAQAHRLAGNKARALTLYRNYIKLFPAHAAKSEAPRHVNNLQAAIESDRKAATAPPTEPVAPANPPAPVNVVEPVKPPPVATTPPPTTTTSPEVSLVEKTSPPKKRTPPWVWGVVAGGIVVVGVGLGVGLGIALQPTRYPNPDVNARLP